MPPLKVNPVVPPDVMAKPMAGQACPCGRFSASTKPVVAKPLPAKLLVAKPLMFAACCARYLDNFESTPAPDAESLMRSRYCAFTLNRTDYLQATWHKSTRPADVSQGDGTKWLGLEVRRHVLMDADHAQVEFVARCRMAGRGARIHELSRFVRELGRWYYVDGDLL